jgi:hypothetical protein
VIESIQVVTTVGATRSADSPAARALAIAQGLEALLAARHDDATARFDAELAAAVTAGRLDDETARTLRWWQRASVRGAQSYLADLLPGVLHADDTAQRRSRAQADLAAASWREATDTTAQIRAAATTDTHEATDTPEATDTHETTDTNEATEATETREVPEATGAANAADTRLRVRLVAVPRHAAPTAAASPTATPNGKDTSGDDHSATTA